MREPGQGALPELGEDLAIAGRRAQPGGLDNRETE